MLNKKCISPVVATALLLVIVVLSIVGFQYWFDSYSSSTFSDVEMKSSNDLGNSKIENVINNELYFINGLDNNVSVTSIKVGEIDCNFSSELVPGMNIINISTCTDNLSVTVNDIVIITNKKVFSKTEIFEKLEINKNVESEPTPEIPSGPLRDYTTVILNDAPIVYWGLDEEEDLPGNTFKDLTATANHGDYIGSPSLNQTGLIAGNKTSIEFGSGNYGYLENDLPSYDSQDITIEAWAYLNAPTSSTIFHFGDAAVSSHRGYFFGITSDLKLRFQTWTDTWVGIYTTNPVITINTTHYIVVTHNSTSEEIKYYVDGLIIETISHTGGIHENSYPIRIGAVKSSSVTEFFNGRLDEIAYYTKVLTPEQILDHYNAGIGN